MPRILRTVLPRIRRSLRERGVLGSLRRSYLLPLNLLQEWRMKRSLAPTPQSEFDAQYGVESDGDLDDSTYLSDLTIAGENWIHAGPYSPIYPQRFAAVMAALPIRHQDFTFIDLGSGKGRVLLLASHYPFRRIIGVEFARELHRTAVKNIARYADPGQRCRALESVCMDFLAFPVPPEPCVFYLFHPSSAAVLSRLFERIRRSLEECPRPAYIAYVAPQEDLQPGGGFQGMVENTEWKFRIYAAGV